jgi:AAA domain
MNAASLQQRFDDARPFAPVPLDSGRTTVRPVEIRASPFRWPNAKTLPRRPWVWGRWLLRETVTAVVAPGGVGKSSFVASMMLALASGREDILGKTSWGGPKTVWYWNLEDSLGELEMQLTAAALFHDVSAAECDSRIFVDSGPEGAELCIALEGETGFQVAVPVVEALVAELLARKVDVLVIDPFVSSHSVNENDNGAIDAVAKTWARIAKRANCAIVLVHHSRKLGGEKVSAESARGGSSLIASARVTLVLNRMDPREAETFGITDEGERRRLFTVQDDKSNRAPAANAEWFRIASQDVGNSTGPDDPYGDHGDNVGVVIRWTPPDAFEGLTADHLLRVQRRIDGGSWKESVQAKDWVGHAVADALGLDASKNDNSDRKRIGRLIRTWIANGALVVVNRRDPVKREDKPFVEVGEWADQACAPLSRGGAVEVGQGGAPQAPRPTSPPLGEVGGAGGAKACVKVGQGGAGGRAPRVMFPSGNPAFRPILAPGETVADPIPDDPFEGMD